MGHGEYRKITGARRDLSTVRDAESVRRLEVRGAGVRSIRGIERMPLLDVVTLSGLESPELELLTRLPRLKALDLGGSPTSTSRPASRP
jgi:hypothetical protein